MKYNTKRYFGIIRILTAMLVVSGFVMLGTAKCNAAESNTDAGNDNAYTFIVLDESDEVPLAPTIESTTDYSGYALLTVTLLVLLLALTVYVKGFNDYKRRVMSMNSLSDNEKKSLTSSSLFCHPIRRERYIKDCEADLASRFI
ncbi:MAG: hypothetical protein K6B28_01625 [Lachnospiraceae bacterium]|nr:hypothetical protein [Lachnospiraceae bacterium]